MKKELVENNAGGLTLIAYDNGEPIWGVYGLERVESCAADRLEELTDWDDYNNCTGTDVGWADKTEQSNDDVTLATLLQDNDDSSSHVVACYDGHTLTIESIPSYAKQIGDITVAMCKIACIKLIA